MNKTLLLFMATTTLLTGCSSATVYHHNSSIVKRPIVTTKSSCWWGEAAGKYSVSTEESVTLCSGNGYSEESEAIANPLEIQSPGDEITVTLADDTITTVTLNPGDKELIQCKSGFSHGYLYVTVTSNPSSETEDQQTTPQVKKTSSCWFGSARGKYTVSAEGYGILCSGNGYSNKDKAIENPLEIESSGCEIVVALSDSATTNATILPGESKLISCESGAFKGYLYVIVL